MLPNINPDQLAAAYEFVRTLEPFNIWALREGRKGFPHADEIEFNIVGDKRVWAWKQRKGDGTYTIAYSDKAPRYVSTFVMLIAHELIHLYQDINKLETTAMHNKDFMVRAKEVCDIHGYDLHLFV